MQVVQSEKLYNYLYKIVLCLILFFLIYNVVVILFISSYEEKELQSRIMSVVNTVESNLKHASPMKSEEIVGKSRSINDTPASLLAGPIKRTMIFMGPVGDEEQIADQYKRVDIVDITDATQIDFKGVTGELVLINVRRKIDEQWYEHGFPMKAGERIGAEKIIGGKKVNFTTNCILQDIIDKARRPVTVMKKVVILNEEGEFVGTKIVPGETFMKSTSKIVYKDDQGSISELWLGETAVVTEETSEEDAEWYEDPVGTAKSKYKDMSKTLKSLTGNESAVKDEKE
ncbi:MAG: hypothetical protein V3U21_05135 [Thermodesulfobacteriota bacterium]